MRLCGDGARGTRTQERTTHVYLHADLALKQRTLDRITPPIGHPGRYRAPHTRLAFLEGL
jgi:hypothetical protein